MNAARRNRPPELAAILMGRSASCGVSAERKIVTNICPIQVVDGGIVVGGRALPFMGRSQGNYSKADLARLFRTSGSTIKRWEKNSRSLQRGRLAANTRVIRYPSSAIIDLIAEHYLRIDVIEAVSLGFPLSKCGAERLAWDGGDGKLLALKEDLAAQVCAAHAAWCRANPSMHEADDEELASLPTRFEGGLGPEDLLGFTVLGDSALRKGRTGAWCTAARCSRAKMDSLVRKAGSLICRAVETEEGQGLLRLLVLTGSK